MAHKSREEQEFEDLSSYSSSKEYKKHRKNRRGLTLGKAAAAAVCVLLMVIGGVMMYISTHLLEGLTTTAITKDPEKLGINAAATVNDGVTNIAVFGVDARNSDFAGLSDAIMIVSVDNRHSKIKMTSILRDSKVSIEGETLNGDHIDWETKINAAYQQGGPELAIRTLNRNFGLDITDYVTLNFADMAEIVDALDGVDIRLTAEEVREINVNLWTLSQEVADQQEQDQAADVQDQKSYPVVQREDFIPDASGALNVGSGNYVGGQFHLNGNQAVAYARIRSVGSDTVRVDRQQVVFGQLLHRVLELGLNDYSGLIRQLLPYCATSLELSSVLALTPILSTDFTLEAIKVPDARYETDLVDGVAEDGISYEVYNVAEAAQRINAFIYEEDSPSWEIYGNTGSNAERKGTSD